MTLILYLIWWLPDPRISFLFDRRRSHIHLTRYYMYRRIADLIENLDLKGKVLAISGGKPIFDMFESEITQIVQTEYPEVDILSLPFEDDSFDVVISDQVLEHVLDPKKAVAETIRVTRSNGTIIHTSCFLNPIHHYPIDLWRFAPDAFAQLGKGTKVIEAGGWGNRSALLLMLMGRANHLIPTSCTHPLYRISTYNDPTYPIVTWLVARKEPGKKGNKAKIVPGANV